MVSAFAIWKFPDGRQEGVIIVGVDDNRDWLGIAGRADRTFLRERALLLDRREEARFGVGEKPLAVGDAVEFVGERTPELARIFVSTETVAAPGEVAGQ